MAKQKIYATRMTINNTCYMAKDYSHRVNQPCLGCHFCYKFSDKFNPRLYLSQWIDEEFKYNKELYMAPIFISRYCEPFYNPTSRRHSLYVAKKFLDNKSQVIFSTYGIEHMDHPEFVDLAKDNKDNIQIQFKLFNVNRESSNIIKNIISPKIPDINNVSKLINKFNFVDRVITIDPFIIGINNVDVKSIIDKMINEYGIKKLIIKQLFATTYFKNYMAKYMGKKDLLTEKVGKFYTYDNIVLLHGMSDILEICYKNNINVFFCMNKEINKILNNKKYNNCCMLEDPIGLYDINKSQMWRHTSNILKLRNNDTNQ